MYRDGHSRQSILELIDEIPVAFFRLSAMAERLHGDLGVGGPHRSILKILFVDGEQTAPDLARRKLVTRQAIQPHLDDLQAKGFVAAVDNPRHRRSNLYSLTKSGIDLCVAIQKRELEELEAWVPDMDPAALASALKAVRDLNEALDARLAEAAAWRQADGEPSGP